MSVDCLFFLSRFNGMLWDLVGFSRLLWDPVGFWGAVCALLDDFVFCCRSLSIDTAPLHLKKISNQ